MSSKLEQLLQQLCPDGVEYKRLGDFATIERGGGFQKKDFQGSGYPCIHYGQIHTRFDILVTDVLTYLSEDTASKQKKAVPGDIIMAVTSEDVKDVCKAVAWLGNSNVAVSGHTAIIHHNENSKYLAYYFNSSPFAVQKRKLAHGTKVIEVTPSDLLDVSIPLPPLDIQNEIARILDKFTELTAELTARKKQYEYYRDLLLNFNNRGGV